MFRYFVQPLCVELTKVVDLWVCAALPLLPDPTTDLGTTSIKLLLQTHRPSHPADEVLGRWEGCCIASCLGRGKMLEQAPLHAPDSAASGTHCSWASRPVWATSLQPLERFRTHGREKRPAPEHYPSITAIAAWTATQAGGNPCVETGPWTSHPAKASKVCQLRSTSQHSPSQLCFSYKNYSIIQSVIKTLPDFGGQL